MRLLSGSHRLGRRGNAVGLSGRFVLLVRYTAYVWPAMGGRCSGAELLVSGMLIRGYKRSLVADGGGLYSDSVSHRTTFSVGMTRFFFFLLCSLKENMLQVFDLAWSYECIGPGWGRRGGGALCVSRGPPPVWD